MTLCVLLSSHIVVLPPSTFAIELLWTRLRFLFPAGKRRSLKRPRRTASSPLPSLFCKKTKKTSCRFFIPSVFKKRQHFHFAEELCSSSGTSKRSWWRRKSPPSSPILFKISWSPLEWRRAFFDFLQYRCEGFWKRRKGALSHRLSAFPSFICLRTIAVSVSRPSAGVHQRAHYPFRRGESRQHFEKEGERGGLYI